MRLTEEQKNAILSDPTTTDAQKQEILKAYENEDKKKNSGTLSIDTADPNQVERAKELLDKSHKNQMEELKMKEKLEGKSELEEENLDLREKLSLIAEVAFNKKKQELGCEDDSIRTPEQLQIWQKGKESESRTDSPSGSAPLQSDYSSEDIAHKKFSSERELVRFLNENKDNPQVKPYFDALWQKTVQTMKEGKEIVFKQDTDSKAEASSQPIELRLTGKERNNPNSELQQFLERGNERVRARAMLERERLLAEEDKKRELLAKKREVEK